MHIIWITTQFPIGEKNRNGMFIYRTVKELSKKYKITVIVLYPIIPPILPMLKNFSNWKNIYKEWREKFPKFPTKPKTANNLNVIYSKYYRPPRPKLMFIESWGAYSNVKKIMKKCNIGQLIIHANWLFPEGYLAKILSKKFDIPFIVTLRGSDFKQLKNNLLNKYFAIKTLNQANKITAVSNSLLKEGKKLGINIPLNKFSITNNFYDFKKFRIESRIDTRRKLKIEEKAKIVFFAGALRKIKNIYLLLDSIVELQKLKKFNLQLLIAGYGYEENNLKKYIKENNINDFVKFIGNIESEMLISYYNASDVFCLPSFSEGFPNVVVESLLCGTPVIGAAVGGIPRIIINKENGYLIDPYSKESLVVALRTALSRNWDREKLRESVSFLSSQNIMKQYSSIYQELFKTISE